MKLKQLEISKFKGIDKLTVPIGEDTTSIFGDNKTGKTTVADSFPWLFFGKDSLNQTNFEIKPIGAEHGTETDVLAVIENGSGPRTFRKVYAEKWTKKRGQAHAEFTGHTVDHFIDGVPVKKKEFDAAVSEICDENLFRLLTNPRYFNEQLHWQDRRRILLEVCGDVTDTEVIERNKPLADLPGIIKNHTMDDYRKIVKARMPEINRELEKIPVRIDEITKGKSAGRDPLTIKGVIEVQRGLRRDKEAELNLINNGGAVAAKKKELAEVEAKLLDLDNKAEKARQASEQKRAKERVKLSNAAADTSQNVYNLASSIERTKKMIPGTQAQIEHFEGVLTKLRKEWQEINATEFTHEDVTTCPTCGQAIPEHLRQEARDKALAEFNSKKAIDLKTNSETGKMNKAHLEQLKQELADIEAKIDGLEKERLAATEAYNTSVAVLKKFDDDQSVVDAEFEPDPKRQKLIEKAESIRSEITQLQAGGQTDVHPIHEAIHAIDKTIEDLQAELAAVENNAKGDARIDELKTQERQLSAEYERLEGEIHLLDEFLKAKVSMLDERINGKFMLARFRMFKELVNGGLEPCCDCMIDGVPYNSANNAARINAGIDICNVLAAHHGVTLPMFVDNAESVTSLMPSNGQQIRLVVSEKDKELRLE